MNLKKMALDHIRKKAETIVSAPTNKKNKHSQKIAQNLIDVISEKDIKITVGPKVSRCDYVHVFEGKKHYYTICV